MADLMQELMDDMRADRVGNLWNKYGKWVIYTAVSIVIVTAVVVYINHYKRNTAMEQTSYYFRATAALAKGEAKEALMALEMISVPDNSTYYGMVLLKKAQAQQMLGNDTEAHALLTELAKRGDMFGDVGKVLLKDEATPDAKRTTALQFTRLEWAAWDAAEKGNKTEAAKQFASLAAMENAPTSLRERAGMMANYFKYKTEGGANE